MRWMCAVKYMFWSCSEVDRCAVKFIMWRCTEVDVCCKVYNLEVY